MRWMMVMMMIRLVGKMILCLCIGGAKEEEGHDRDEMMR